MNKNKILNISKYIMDAAYRILILVLLVEMIRMGGSFFKTDLNLDFLLGFGVGVVVIRLIIRIINSYV